MLSKLIGTSVILMLFLIPSTADAHHRHGPPVKHAKKAKPAKVVVAPPGWPNPPIISVTVGWTWVEATLLRRAHWHHPHYGHSHRAFTAGPPPARPHDHAVWVPGHWEGPRRHKVWVPGHWQ